MDLLIPCLIYYEYILLPWYSLREHPVRGVFDQEMILFGRKAPGLTIPSEVILLWYLSCLTEYGLTDRPGDGPRLIWGLHREISWKNQRNIDIWSYFLYKLLSGNFRQIVTDQILLRCTDKNAINIKYIFIPGIWATQMNSTHYKMYSSTIYTCKWLHTFIKLVFLSMRLKIIWSVTIWRKLPLSNLYRK